MNSNQKTLGGVDSQDILRTHSNRIMNEGDLPF